jgi:hypothetical protein
MREITPMELARLVNSGATVKEEDHGPMEIQGFGELVSMLGQMLKANEARIQADAARSAALSDSLSALQSMIKSFQVNNDVDLSPLKTVLSEIKANTQPCARASYTFSVQRSGQGYIEGITATPKTD